MIHYIISSLLTFITTLFLSVFIYFKNKDNLINKVYSIYSLMMAFWSFCFFRMITATNRIEGLFWARTLHIPAIFIPIFFIHFVFIQLNVYKQKKKIIIVGYSICFILLSLTYTPFFVVDALPIFTFNYFIVPGNLYHLFTTFFFTLSIYGHYSLFKGLKKAQGLKRNQIKYVLIAYFIGYCGGATAFLPLFKISTPRWGLYPISICMIIIAYAIMKYRLMDIQMVITRAGIFLTLYIIVLGIPFFIGYHTHSWFLSTSVAVVLASVGPLVYRILERNAEDLILAEQRRYHKILIHAAKGMSREHNLGRLLEIIVRIVKKTVKIDFAAVFLIDNEAEVFRLKAIHNKIQNPEQVFIPFNHPLIGFIREKKEPFFLAELFESVKNPFDLPITPSLIVPSFFEDELLGFLLLGEKVNRKIYSVDDLNVFKILAQQTALAVENCIFYEESKKSLERVFNAEKLASIGGMADGIAHQIKNRLHHFSLVAGEQQYEIESFIEKNTELYERTPEIQQTFKYLKETSDSLIANVHKTSAIIQGILNFARVEEKETYFNEFSLVEVINNAKELLNIKHRLNEFPIELEVDSTDIIYGVKAQIIECMINLLDNGYEAAKEKKDFHLDPEEKLTFKPLIKLKVIQTDTKTIIKVSDNGLGMKEENIRKVFAPFFTTKSSAISGSGIGMYVVKRMIEENHKGKVYFETKYGEGTTFTVELPRRTNK